MHVNFLSYFNKFAIFRRSEAKFADYVRAAGPKMQFWRLGLGILLFLAVYILGMIAIVLGAELLGWDSIALAFALPELDARNIAITLFVSFTLWHLALVLVLWVLHKRAYLTLWGRDQWKPFLITFGIVAVLVAFGTWSRIASGEAELQMLFRDWLRWVPLLIVILMIQISAEEFLFRGYILQSMAALWDNRIGYVFIPSILFGALHFDGQYDAATPWVLASTTLIGIIAAELTKATGGLGAACAVHFINNFVVLGILPARETLTGFGLYVSRHSLDDFDAILPLLQSSVFTLSGVLIFYYAILGYRALRQKRL